MSAKDRIKEFLRARVGEVVTSQQIHDVAQVTEFARRLREIRQEEGWKISSHNDRSDLKQDEYRLEEPPPEIGTYQFAKPISNRLRSQVLERNGYTCQMCGVGPGDTMDNGRKARLHVGHIVDRDHGGKDVLTNLRALCSQCNQGAQNIAQEPPSHSMVLAQVRRAKEDDQRAILKWLKRKFEESAEH